MNTCADYVKHLQENEVASFTTEEIAAALGEPPEAIPPGLRQLKEEGRVASPSRDFHVVVPPAYRQLGCLPPRRFIHRLMEHLGLPYYVALLSAGEYHGAAHQAPQVFQVMVEKDMPNIMCGLVPLQFFARSDMRHTPLSGSDGPSENIRVSSPEATALEVVGYHEPCGYLDNVATILAELGGDCDGDALEAEARRAPVDWVQRLGYLLAFVGWSDFASRIENVLSERETTVVRLETSEDGKGHPVDPRWNVAVNDIVDPDVYSFEYYRSEWS